jgi:uncharacterized protein YehS (DUF1456 family)
MTRNDILIRVRYALNITDLALVEIFTLGGKPMKVNELRPLFLKETDPGFKECDGPTLGSFLQGLVTSRRGPGPDPGTSVAPRVGDPNNNDILKALRIALTLKDNDVADILRSAGASVTVSEINAFFRKEGHPKYQSCGDQFLRNFLSGLTKKYRV